MPSWANLQSQQFDDDMIDGGVHQLTVGGLTTALGGLQIGAVGQQMVLNTVGNVSRIEAPLNDGVLMLNADAPLETGDVIISHPDNGEISQPNVIVQSPRFMVGSNGIPGQIDTNGNGGANDFLKLGTRNITNHVEIGRSQQFATVKGPLFAEEHIQVGTTAAGGDGKVDAAAPVGDLKLGTDAAFTRDVIICRAGQSVVVLGGTVYLDLALSLAVKVGPARGFGPCLDLVASGNTHFYVDTAGGHNL